jgi:hypothetical protein
MLGVLLSTGSCKEGRWASDLPKPTGLGYCSIYIRISIVTDVRTRRSTVPSLHLNPHPLCHVLPNPASRPLFPINHSPEKYARILN